MVNEKKGSLGNFLSSNMCSGVLLHNKTEGRLASTLVILLPGC